MPGKNAGFTGRIKRGPMAADVLGAHFTTVFNQAIRDKRISRRARGLLVEILSHTDGYGISVGSLVAGGPEGRDSIRTALGELEVHGYLRRGRERNAQGQLGESIYEITDMPEGVTITAPPPPADDETSPTEENRRSEPKNWKSDTGQKPRSEPKSDFPTLASPTLADPPHKKTNTPTGKKTTSLSPPSPSHLADADEEREKSSSDQPHPTPSPAGGGAEEVLAAYRDAFKAVKGGPPPRAAVRRVGKEAVELLGEGWTVEALVQRVADLPQFGTSLVKHVANAPAPVIPKQRKSAEWPQACGDHLEGADESLPLRTRETPEGGVYPCPKCHPGVVGRSAEVG